MCASMLYERTSQISQEYFLGYWCCASVYLCIRDDYGFFNVYLFLRERGKQSTRAQREGDTESKAGSRLRDVSTESNVGLELMDREIMT